MTNDYDYDEYELSYDGSPLTPPSDTPKAVMALDARVAYDAYTTMLECPSVYNMKVVYTKHEEDFDVYNAVDYEINDISYLLPRLDFDKRAWSYPYSSSILIEGDDVLGCPFFICFDNPHLV